MQAPVKDREGVNIPELTFQAVVNYLTWVLGTKFGFFAKIASAFTLRAISLAPQFIIFSKKSFENHTCNSTGVHSYLWLHSEFEACGMRKFPSQRIKQNKKERRPVCASWV